MIHYLSAILACSIWGLSPVFWKLLINFETFELASYRVLVSFLCFIPFFNISKYKLMWSKIKTNKMLTLISCGLMFNNIYLFVYAVNSGQILEASFGYFLSPVLSMALAYFVLKETISPIKLVAIIFAVISVIIKLTTFTTFPWVSLALGGGFALYGLIRKFLVLNATEMTFSEMSFISIPALIILLNLGFSNELYFNNASVFELSLLPLAWVPTLLPFLFFSFAAKHIELNILSFIQYLSPSIQFVLAVFVYKEYIETSQWISFALIWLACSLIVTSSLRRRYNARK